jgi:peptide/nickel transport system permease protein
MLSYVARRAVHAVPVLFGVSLIAFFLVRLTPGDPVALMLGTRATPASIAYWNAYFGFDSPLWSQYFDFLRRIITLDLGDSVQYKLPVSTLILSRLGPTLALICYSVVLSLLLAIPIATIAALRAGRRADHGVNLLMNTTMAMPAFWVALAMVTVFSLRLGWFPASGLREGLGPLIWSLTLPAITLSLALTPLLVRSLRATMIESLTADHLQAARARGLPEGIVVRRYVLRNSFVATATLLGLIIGFLIGGSVIVENVFAIPGIGQLIVGAVSARDFPVVQSLIVLIGVWIVTVNIVTDLVAGRLDPRIRH